jgi:2-oxoglutarate dehydrogenase E2 component (dihydrolipoamide succinyltransferase)
MLVLMPQMGVSVAEGTLAVWHKREGDWVERDETVCEVSSDKIDTEVPSPAAGRIEELLVAEGETVPVGTPLARIAGDAEPGQPHPVEREDPPAQARAASTGASGPAPEAPRRVISPVVQRIASEHGLDLAGLRGSGRGGRIRKQDVLALVNGALGSSNARESEGAPAGAPGDVRAGETEPAAEGGEPLSRMRRAIAEHMTRSLRTAATCTTITEADFSRVERERARVGCSPLAFVASATVQALRRHPDLNATLEEELLTRHGDVNLGIAVSLGEDGLIVPVIERAQELSVEGLAQRIRELARRARANELAPEEVRGGTFTITNPGGFGSIASTPIINQPQVAILDLEAVVRRPVVIADEDGMEAIAIRPMANLCLSWDHRALDGALAAQFLATLRLLIEKGSDV